MSRSEKFIPVFRHGLFDGPGAIDPSFKNFVSSISEDAMLYPLTETGRLQILKAVRLLPNFRQLDLFLVSEYARTRQSAEALATEIKIQTGREIEIIASHLLNPIWMPPDSLSQEEFNSLMQTGRKNAVADVMFQKWVSGQIGETPERVKARIDSFLGYLKETLAGNSFNQPVVITHASFASAMQRYILGADLIEPRNETQILKVAGYYFLTIKDSPDLIIPGINISKDQYLSEK